MRQSLPSGLLADLWSDLHNTDVLWQIGTLVICLAIGGAAARVLRARLTGGQRQLRVMQLGVESFAQVLPPVLSLALVAIAQPLLEPWQHVNLLKVAIPLLASFALIRLVFYILRRVFSRSGSMSDFLLLFEKLFAILVWGAVALYVTGLWPELVRSLEHTVIPMGRNQVSLLTVVQALTSVIATLMLALWASAMLEERLMRMDTVHSSLRVVMARMGRAVFILMAILISLSLVGIDLTVLSVFGGALGVGIGLGLQKIVSSYVSGFVILLERSLSIGDIVAVDKYSGVITQINTRYTIVRSADGIETVVPNEVLVLGPVQNYSLTDRAVRLVTHVTVAYQTDIETVLHLLERTAVLVPRVAKTPAPQGLLMKFGDDGFALELGFWIADPENGRANVLSDVNRAVWRALQEHQIEVPYPQREVRFVGVATGVANSTAPESAVTVRE
jgi:small-conductance mechanosensitive channel